MKGGVPLYRDSDHLSVAGAMAMEGDIRRGLSIEPGEFDEVGQLAVATKPAP